MLRCFSTTGRCSSFYSIFHFCYGASKILDLTVLEKRKKSTHHIIVFANTYKLYYVILLSLQMLQNCCNSKGIPFSSQRNSILISLSFIAEKAAYHHSGRNLWLVSISSSECGPSPIFILNQKVCKTLCTRLWIAHFVPVSRLFCWFKMQWCVTKMCFWATFSFQFFLKCQITFNL